MTTKKHFIGPNRISVTILSVLSILVFATPSFAEFDQRVHGQSDRPALASSQLSGDKETEEVDRIFTSVFNHDTPGCSVSVEKDGRSVLERGYGSSTLPTSDLDSRRIPISPSTRMRIASITKSMVATATLILRRELMRTEGDLLNKTLADIYPFFRHKRGFSSITVRQLLEHTSSLIRDIPDSFPLHAPLYTVPIRLYRMGDAAFLHPMPPHLSENLGGIRGIQRPGARFSYSNVGYIILADIISQKSGMDFKEFMRRKIFEPLQMKDTNLGDAVEEQGAGRLAHSYVSAQNGFQTTDPDPYIGRFYEGAGGINSTASDLLRFSRAIDEHKLLSPEDWRLAFAPSKQSLTGPVGPYGLGWLVTLDAKDAKRRPATLYLQEHDGYLTEGFMGDLLRAQREVPPCHVSVAVLCNLGPDPENPTVGLQFSPEDAANQIVDIYCQNP